MKCPACGYTHETKTETAQIDYGSFQEVCISHCKVRHWGKTDTWGLSFNEDDELSFNVCPECGCMFIARS